jgi:drug/metabolite transporter (DMT)-like permease
VALEAVPPLPEARAPSHSRVIAVMAFVILVWSINYTVAKIGLQHLRPAALASFRIVVAGLAMFPVAVWCGLQQRRQAASGRTGRLKPIARCDLWNFACLGFFGIFLNQGIFTIGLSMTSVGRSAIIVATTPIFILLAAWMRGLERLSRRKFAGLAVAFAGALVLGAGRGWDVRSTGSRGDFLIFCACMSVVTFVVLGKRMAAASYDPLQLMAYNVTFAGLFALPVAAWEAGILTRAGEWGAIGWQGWGAVAYMGVLSSATCISLYFWVLRWLPPSKVGALSYLQPVVGTPFAALVLGEAMTRDLLSGGALILAGVYTIESDASEQEYASERNSTIT